MTPYELHQEAAIRSRSPGLVYSLLAAFALAGCVVGWFVLGSERPVPLRIASAAVPLQPPVLPHATEEPQQPAVAPPVTNPPPQPVVEQKPPPPAPPPVAVETPAPQPPPPPASAPVAAPAATPSPEGSTILIEEARKLKGEDNLTDARVKALEALRASTSVDARAAAENLLSEIAIPLVFSKRPMAEKVEYTVVSGDSLDRLARRFGTTVEVVRRGNNLPGQVIRVGTRLRILQAKCSLVVDKSENTLVLKLNDQFFKRYRVGTGQYSTTPTGEFKINGKVAQPTWFRPDGKSIPYGDKENLLGTHWMSIDVPGFGLHGTWEPDSVGKQSSQGCIRLVNADIEELFNIVPEGTPVLIQD